MLLISRNKLMCILFYKQYIFNILNAHNHYYLIITLLSLFHGLCKISTIFLGNVSWSFGFICNQRAYSAVWLPFPLPPLFLSTTSWYSDNNFRGWMRLTFIFIERSNQSFLWLRNALIGLRTESRFPWHLFGSILLLHWLNWRLNCFLVRKSGFHFTWLKRNNGD